MSLESQRKFLVAKMKQIDFQFPIEYPNQPFDRPVGQPYGRFDIMGGTPIVIGGQGKGKAKVKYVHMIQLTVWCPEGKGVAPAGKGGDAFAKKFQLKQGRDDEGDFYRFDAIQPFGTKVVNGDHVQVYRIAYTRDSMQPIDIGMSL
jgi:hypothetical protein